MTEERVEGVGNTGERGFDDAGTTSASAGVAPFGLDGQPSPQTQRIILDLLSGDAFKEDPQVSELVTKVRESITEISANSKPRKRARLRDSVDWTIEDIGLENLAEEKQYSTDMEMAEIESDRQNLDEICAATGGDQEHLMKVAAGLLGEEAGVKGQPNIGSFALNAVVVLAKEALKRNGEQHHSKVLQDTLEKMHLQYTSLANECTCLQDKLKNEKETCSVLEKDVQRIHSGLTQLQGENEQLKGALQNLETQIQCQICYEEKRNCLLMPCLHFLFCARCIDQHFQSNENGHRQCPVCRKGVSGVLMMQLE